MKTALKPDLYRSLPSVDDLLRQPEIITLTERESQHAVVEAIRVVLAKLREEITAGHLSTDQAVQLAIAGLPDGISRQLHTDMELSPKPVINANRMVWHT